MVLVFPGKNGSRVWAGRKGWAGADRVPGEGKQETTLPLSPWLKVTDRRYQPEGRPRVGKSAPSSVNTRREDTVILVRAKARGHRGQGADSRGGEAVGGRGVGREVNSPPNLRSGIHSPDDWIQGVATAVGFGFSVKLRITVEKDEKLWVRC